MFTPVQSQRLEDILHSLGPLPRAIPLEATQTVYRKWRSRATTVAGQPLVEILDSLIGPLPLSQRAEIANRIVLTEFQNKCLSRSCGLRGLNFLPEMIRCNQGQTLKEFLQDCRPAILLFAHLGPPRLVAPALGSIDVPALIIRRESRSIPRAAVQCFADRLPGLEFIDLPKEGDVGAYALKRSVDQLRQGKLLAMPIDGTTGNKNLETFFLGRPLSVARGPAVVARLTGAPIIPFTLSWQRASWLIDLEIGPPLAPPATKGLSAEARERAILESAVSWFEGRVRARPEQLRLEWLQDKFKKPASGWQQLAAFITSSIGRRVWRSGAAARRS